MIIINLYRNVLLGSHVCSTCICSRSSIPFTYVLLAHISSCVIGGFFYFPIFLYGTSSMKDSYQESSSGSPVVHTEECNARPSYTMKKKITLLALS